MAAGVETQLLSVAGWLVLVTFLQLSLYPLLRRWLGDIAFPASFPVSLLGFTLVSWYAGMIHLPLQVALIPFAVLGIIHIVSGQYSKEDLSRYWRYEALFLVFFLFMLELRYLNPAISSTEKFMDQAFIASVMRQPVVPPFDPWFSGGYLTIYYYLGYWLVAALGLCSGVPSNIAFNLALPTVLGTSAVSVYAASSLVVKRFRWLPLLTFIMMNPAFFSLLAPEKGLGSVFWDSTRTITDTIHEYPLFSFLLGDVHPHVVGLMVQSALLMLLFFAITRWNSLSIRQKTATGVTIALALGTMLPLNTWDLFAYAPLVLATGLYIALTSTGLPFSRWLRKGPARLPSDPVAGSVAGHPLFQFWVLVPAVSVLMYLPFLLMLDTGAAQGIGWVTSPSSPVQFLLAHGVFIVLLTATLVPEMKKRPYLLLVPVLISLCGYPAIGIATIPLVFLFSCRFRDPEHLMAAAGLIALIVCEIVFIRDSFAGGEYYRMNTVFKFSYVAWVLLGVSTFIAVARALEQLRLPAPSRPWSAVLPAIAVAVLFLVPLVVPIDVPYGETRTLDGMAYLDNAHPGDAAAIAYLRTLPGNHTVVEAVEGDYSYYSRISTFTGIPTILGWPFHEVQWRSSTGDWYAERTTDIASIYEDPDQCTAIMDRYGADLLVVGDLEQEKYNVLLPETGLLMVHESDGTAVYRRGT